MDDDHKLNHIPSGSIERLVLVLVELIMSITGDINYPDSSRTHIQKEEGNLKLNLDIKQIVREQVNRILADKKYEQFLHDFDKLNNGNVRYAHEIKKINRMLLTLNHTKLHSIYKVIKLMAQINKDDGDNTEDFSKDKASNTQMLSNNNGRNIHPAYTRNNNNINNTAMQSGGMHCVNSSRSMNYSTSQDDEISTLSMLSRKKQKTDERTRDSSQDTISKNKINCIFEKLKQTFDEAASCSTQSTKNKTPFHDPGKINNFTFNNNINQRVSPMYNIPQHQHQEQYIIERNKTLNIGELKNNKNNYVSYMNHPYTKHPTNTNTKASLVKTARLFDL